MEFETYEMNVSKQLQDLKDKQHETNDLLEKERQMAHDKNLKYEKDIRNLAEELEKAKNELAASCENVTSLQSKLQESESVAHQQVDFIKKMEAGFAEKVYTPQHYSKRTKKLFCFHIHGFYYFISTFNTSM